MEVATKLQPTGDRTKLIPGKVTVFWWKSPVFTRTIVHKWAVAIPLRWLLQIWYPLARAQVKPATSLAPLLHRSVANRRTRPLDTSKHPRKNPSPHIKNTMFIIDHKKSNGKPNQGQLKGVCVKSLGEESYPVPTGVTEAMWFEIGLMAIKCGLWYWLAITSLESNETA